MKYIPLKEMAKIDISNVDKKSKEGESEVVLCNFVDVYHNWAITKELVPTLMRATANENQIERFSIRKGQVAITKDSETRDDIGISAYIADDIVNGVLGYHCALITPNETILRGKYLNIVLHSPYAQKYFEANASGSGQRYTLTNEIIENFPVPMPDGIDIQDDFGRLCSDIDAKISNNTAVCSHLEAMARLLYNYWFVQFDFPDENGKPYKSSGGKMVWNEELKREIPEGWEVKPLLFHMDCNVNTLKANDKYPIISYLDTSNLTRNCVSDIQIINESEGYPSRAKRIVCKNDILFSTVRPNQEHYGIIKAPVPNMIASTGFAILSSKVGSEFNELFYLFLTQHQNLFILNTIANNSVSSYPSINPEDILNLKFALPKRLHDVSGLTRQFNMIFQSISKKQAENKELTALRDFLLPMLMNGQVKVGKEGA